MIGTLSLRLLNAQAHAQVIVYHGIHLRGAITYRTMINGGAVAQRVYIEIV
jgi:hypothetical protein